MALLDRIPIAQLRIKALLGTARPRAAYRPPGGVNPPLVTTPSRSRSRLPPAAGKPHSRRHGNVACRASGPKLRVAQSARVGGMAARLTLSARVLECVRGGGFSRRTSPPSVRRHLASPDRRHHGHRLRV